MLHVFVVTSKQKSCFLVRGVPENVGKVLRVSPFFMCLEFGSHGVLALCYAACAELVGRD